MYLFLCQKQVTEPGTPPGRDMKLHLLKEGLSKNCGHVLKPPHWLSPAIFPFHPSALLRPSAPPSLFNQSLTSEECSFFKSTCPGPTSSKPSEDGSWIHPSQRPRCVWENAPWNSLSPSACENCSGDGDVPVTAPAYCVLGSSVDTSVAFSVRLALLPHCLGNTVLILSHCQCQLLREPLSVPSDHFRPPSSEAQST